MEREERYYIIKKSDLKAAINCGRLIGADLDTLQETLERLNTQRFVDDKEPLKAVVVESDWPEYEQVWKMIEDRVNVAPSRLAELKRKADLFDKLRDLMGYIENGTEQSVGMFQDDATRWYSVTIGRGNERKGESAPGLEQAINTMHQKYGGE